MSVWELSAAVDGWIAAHVPEKPGAMSIDEQDEIWAAVVGRMH